jgi:HEPN domain-containing protein
VAEAERWLAFAEEDLAMARLALAEGILRQTCFHAQQAAEKAIKGFLEARIGTHPRTHSLDEMFWRHRDVLGELAPWREAWQRLDLFYLPTRYADALPGLVPTGGPGRGTPRARWPMRRSWLR